MITSIQKINLNKKNIILNIHGKMRTPGIEPGQRAWKALIITSRSHPHFLTLYYFSNYFLLKPRHI